MKTLLICTVAAVAAGAAAQKLERPAPGSKLRKAVLDGLRPAIEKDLKQKVIFKIQTLNVYDGWAFVDAQPLQPGGKKIDFKKTRYREAVENDFFGGDQVFALLRLSKSKWTVKDFVIGPTDVYWIGWMDKPFSAPKALFPKIDGKKD